MKHQTVLSIYDISKRAGKSCVFGRNKKKHPKKLYTKCVAGELIYIFEAEIMKRFSEWRRRVMSFNTFVTS